MLSSTLIVIVLFVYFLICAAQLQMRRQLEEQSPERIRIRMWLYPWLTYLAMIAIIVVVGSMYFIKDSRSQLVLSLLSLAVVIAAYLVRKRLQKAAGRAIVTAGAAQ